MARLWSIHTLQSGCPRFAPSRVVACGAVVIGSLLAAVCGCRHAAPARSPGNAPAGSLSYALERAAALKAGYPVTPEALQAKLPPPQQNAAPLYEKLARLLEARPLAPQITKLSSHIMPSNGQFQRAGAALARASDQLYLLRQAAKRPRCVFLADWSDPNSVETIKPATTRTLARLLRAQGLVLANQGRPLDAVQWQALGFHIARHIADQNWGYSDAYFVESSTFSGLAQILLLAGNVPGVAEAVGVAIEKEWRPLSLSRSLKTRAGITAVILEKLRAAGPDAITPLIRATSQKPQTMDADEWNAFVDENAGLLLRHFRAIVAVADKPYPHSYPIVRAAEAKVASDTDPRHLLLVLMDEQHDFMVEQRASALARAEVTRAAAAVLAWKVQNRTVPVNLDLAISPVPADPFSGEPLAYRSGRGSFVTYSVGKTENFDGGKREQMPPNQEAVFRYPLPPALKGPITD